MENRVVLVTGGASGIGKGMVRMFADRGCQVIIFDVHDYSHANAPVVADLCTTTVALSAPLTLTRIIANHDSHDWLNNYLIFF